MNLQWLSAPEREVIEAISTSRMGDRPKWVPTWRKTVLLVNNCLMLWYIAIASFTMSVRIDTLQNNEILPRDIRDIVVLVAILVGWILGTIGLERWADRPEHNKAHIRQGRAALTAIDNGFEPKSTAWTRFNSLITIGLRYFYPRFAAVSGTEFGNLKRHQPRSSNWHYLRVPIGVNVPHLILDSTKADAVRDVLPVIVGSAQKLSLEGDFDDWFRVFVPAEYEVDALTLLTPDVMLALTEHAHEYSVELIDDSVVFFAPGHADFVDPEAWQRIDAVLQHVVPPLRSNAFRYRDGRVPTQARSRTETYLDAFLSNEGTGKSQRGGMRDLIVGDRGRRLRIVDFRTGIWEVLSGIRWVALFAFLYGIPTVFAIAGIMAIVDGR